MNDEALSNDIRRFLKKVGIQSHQAIEKTIHDRLNQGKLTSKQPLKARMRLSIEDIQLEITIDGEINVDAD